MHVSINIAHAVLITHVMTWLFLVHLTATNHQPRAAAAPADLTLFALVSFVCTGRLGFRLVVTLFVES